MWGRHNTHPARGQHVQWLELSRVLLLWRAHDLQHTITHVELCLLTVPGAYLSDTEIAQLDCNRCAPGSAHQQKNSFNNDWQNTCNKGNYKEPLTDSTSFIQASYMTFLESHTSLEKDFLNWTLLDPFPPEDC